MSLPTHKFKPIEQTSEPNLRSASSLRARLFAGGTYFRSKEQGRHQNNISVEVIQLQEPTSLTAGLGFCVVTNHNIDPSQNLSEKLSTTILSFKDTTYADYWEIKRGTSHSLIYTAISVEIRFALQSNPNLVLPPPITTQVFEFGKLMKSGKLSVKVLEKTPPGAIGSSIFIAPGVRIYQLLVKEIPPPPDPAGGSSSGPPTYGWDIGNLRSQVNADNQWIEMIERSGPIDDGSGGPLVPNPNAADVQDSGTDASSLSPFSQTFLAGADGLPDGPSSENTGPTRTLIHINQGEASNGELTEINKIYEWVGDSAVVGSWQPY